MALEQLIYPVFLKIADKHIKPPYDREVGIPVGYVWASLNTRYGADIKVHYVAHPRKPGERKGPPGQIFAKARNKITDSACGTGGFSLAAYEFLVNPESRALDRARRNSSSIRSSVAKGSWRESGGCA